MLSCLTDQEYDDVMTVCSMFPVIEMDVKPHGKTFVFYYSYTCRSVQTKFSKF